MNILQLRNAGYKIEFTPSSWEVIYTHILKAELIGEGNKYEATQCDHRISREKRRWRNREAARQCAIADFVKRRLQGHGT